MGGIGSGRHWRHGAADCTADYRQLDVRRWQRDGLLAPGQAFGWNWSRDGETVASIQVRTEASRVILSYRHRTHGGPWKDEAYPVPLAWTPCTYGGQRAWFLCPANGCGRRVAILYGRALFACRHCHRLAYRSQRETAGDRAMRRANTIRSRLGWTPGLLNALGNKPKGMRWRTFERLLAEYQACLEQSLAATRVRLDRLRQALKRHSI